MTDGAHDSRARASSLGSPSRVDVVRAMPDLHSGGNAPPGARGRVNQFRSGAHTAVGPTCLLLLLMAVRDIRVHMCMHASRPRGPVYTVSA